MTHSINSISELTNDKVQDIINNFFKYNDNDNTDMKEISSHRFQPRVLTKI